MQENKYQEILKQYTANYPIPFCSCLLIKEKGTILAANEKALTFFNTSEKIILGKDILVLLKKLGINEISFTAETTLENPINAIFIGHKTYIYFIKNISKDTENIPLPDDELILFFWAEIPYQKKESPELLVHDFDVLLDSIHDGIWIINGNGITLYANKAMKRIAGISPKDVIGKHVTIPMIQGKFTNCVTLNALNQKKTVTQFDDYSNGKHCLNTSTPILDENGNVEKVVAIIRDMAEYDDLLKKVIDAEQSVKQYKGELKKFENGSKYIGTSKTFQNCLEQLKKVAKSPSCVLLLGETGTGKSLAASFIHENSSRKDRPFIAINCAAIAESLIDSELFGYEKGSFTGADQAGRRGYFEQADKGTLLLDEIGELPLSVQAKLLHVLDNYGFHRVGGNTLVNVDVRIIAATNRPLDELVKRKEFREDLFYRLHILNVNIPPLRERQEDIPELAKSFLADACKRLNTTKSFAPKTLLALSSFSWPGNVRELRGAVEYLAAMTEGNLIRPSDLHPYVFKEKLTENTQTSIANLNDKTLEEAVFELEYTMIKDTLVQEGSTYKAAKKLGISQSTVVRKAKHLGIKISD
jgi:PAS domain S-box-containing protein